MAHSPLLELPGAVVYGRDDDSAPEGLGVALHYGQPIAEARHLDEGEAFVDLSHRGVVTVTGADRLSWVESMTSQALTGLQPGESTETLLLTPQGRIQHAIRAVDDGTTLWLLVDAGEAADLTAFLTRMRFALRVEVSNESDTYAQLTARPGPALQHLIETLHPVVVWEDHWASVQRGGIQYAAPYDSDWDMRVLVISRNQLPDVAQLVRDGATRVAGIAALDAVELAAWRVGATDVDDRTLPHELDWMRTAVHLTKGCYRGQETVAKVHNLGHPPRRITLLHLEGSEGEAPQPGALVYEAGKDRPVGRVTRAAVHHDWGVIAFAMLKRMTAEDAELVIPLDSGAEAQATQDVIVPQSAGASRDIPRLRRL